MLTAQSSKCELLKTVKSSMLKHVKIFLITLYMHAFVIRGLNLCQSKIQKHSWEEFNCS